MPDTIRIVPLKLPDAARAAPATVSLTYRGGPVLSSVSVFSVFWGSQWNQAPLAALMQTMNGFFDYIVTSALLDQLAEYSVQGSAIRHGSDAGSTVVATPAPPSSTVSDAAIQQLLSDQITSNSAFVKPTPNTLYVLFLPPDLAVTQGGTSSCQGFCGYHDSFGANRYYAVLPYLGCAGCSSGYSIADATTIVASHELSEAITDPVPGQGWYDDQNGEIGDICAWQTKKLGAFTIQLEWSNKAGKCL